MLTREEAEEVASALMVEIIKRRETNKQDDAYGRVPRFPKDGIRVLSDALGKVADDLERLRPVPPKAVA